MHPELPICRERVNRGRFHAGDGARVTDGIGVQPARREWLHPDRFSVAAII
jgi:hypothetical protein